MTSSAAKSAAVTHEGAESAHFPAVDWRHSPVRVYPPFLCTLVKSYAR